MNRWRSRLAELQAHIADALPVQNVQNVQNVQCSLPGPAFEQFERFEHGPAHADGSASDSVAAPKPELLAPLFKPVPPSEGESGFEQKCAARRGRVEERQDGSFVHFCTECGRWGAFGYGVSLRAGRLGRWYCAEHRPISVRDGRSREPSASMANR